MEWMFITNAWTIFKKSNTIESSMHIIEWAVPSLNDGMHPSHHSAYGSRTERFTIHLFNRYLHQSKLFCTFSTGYRFSWESVTQLMKITAPIIISRRIAFSPSPSVRPMQFFCTSFSVGTMTSADFSTMPTRGCGDLPR